MAKTRFARPRLTIGNCVDCKAEFNVSRTKVSPRCEDCRVDYNRAQSRHTYRVQQAYRAAMSQLSGPSDVIKTPGSEVEEEVIQQMPGISYEEEWAIIEREWELQELTQCMEDSDRFSYGSGWQGVSPEDWQHVEDVAGSVLYDNQSGLRMSSPTTRSPRLPIGTNEGTSTNDRDLQALLGTNAARARDDAWFTLHPWWQYESLTEIEQAQEVELSAIRQRAREAVAREQRLLNESWIYEHELQPA